MAAKIDDMVTRKEVVEYLEFLNAEVRRLQDDQAALFKMMRQVIETEHDQAMMIRDMFTDFKNSIAAIMGQRIEPEQTPRVN